MAKALKTIGMIAGAVALVATGVGAFAVAGSALAATAASVASIASLASGVASIGATALAKPPSARGSVTQMIIQSDAPQPYLMGEGYFAGVLRAPGQGYGGTVDGTPNPYKFWPVVYSGGGPVQSITPLVDFAAVGSWYTGFLATDTQLGACPESTALAPFWSGCPEWSAAHKLSGQAAIGWNFRFDKKGKRFASGIPATGAMVQGVKVYDPRLDSTFPGGSGAHRLGTESTYEYSANPALHAGTYAFGRYQNGQRTMGIGLPGDAIDWQVVASWANTCDLNGWTMFGVVFEGGAGDQAQLRWDNLKEICSAGGGQPVPGGILSFQWHAPVVALDTITQADATDAADSVVAMQSYRDRVNIIIPKYRSPAHNWELVQAEDVRVTDYITDDGEERPREWPFSFVTDKDQAAQLAAYKLVDAREFHPIELTCGPRLRAYRPGDCLHIDRPDLGLDTPAVVLKREIDPQTMNVKLTLMGETAAKHAFALGQTGVAPSAPVLGMDGQARDETAAGVADRQVSITVPALVTFPADAAGVVNAGLLPATITPQVLLGGSDIRIDDTASYALAGSGVTATVNNTTASADKGRITITAVDALNGWLDLTVTVGGVPGPAQRIVVQKGVGLPASSGGSGSKFASTGAFDTISTTSYAPISGVLTVTLASGESLYGTAPLDYWISATISATRTVQARWEYSPAGAGTWTAFATGVFGSAAVSSPYSELQENGYGDFTQSKSGLSAGDYDVRLVGLLDASGLSVGFAGTALIEAKV